MHPKSISVDQVHAAIVTRARSAGWKAAVSIALGIMLTLIGPLVMAGFVWAIALFGWHKALPCGWTFLATAAVIVPILYWYAARGSDHLLLDAVSGGGTDTAAGLWAISRMVGGPIGDIAAVGAMAANPRAAAAGFQEIFLFGPRLVVQGTQKWRAARQLAQADTQAAAKALTNLLPHTQAVPVEKWLGISKLNEPAILTLTFLVYHEWISLSEDGKRAWPLTDAKRDLGLQH